MVLTRLFLLFGLYGCIHKEFPSLYEDVVERSRRLTPNWVDADKKFVLEQRSGFYVSKRARAKDVKSALNQLETYGRQDLRRVLHRVLCPSSENKSEPNELLCAEAAKDFIGHFVNVEDIYFERIFAYDDKETFYNLYVLFRFTAGKPDLIHMLTARKAKHSLKKYER